MSDCCCPEPATRFRETCPVCHGFGRPVETGTLKALLKPSALGRLHSGRFHVCLAAGCDVVYFSSDGQLFHADDVSVAVWEKQSPGDRTFCYCFGENERELRREIELTGDTRALERVRQHIADRRCACEIRNPRGTCCLGDLTRAVAALREEARATKG